MSFFTFSSFTVTETGPLSIAAYAEYSYQLQYPPTASQFTYTVVVGENTYIYTTATTPNFQPTLDNQAEPATFTFVFQSISAPFSQLFVPGIQTHTLNFNSLEDDIDTTSDPVIFERIFFTFASFELTLYDNDTIRANFAYTYGGFTPISTNFKYYLNDEILDNEYITWTISNVSGIGTGFADFSRTNVVTAPLFTQASTQTNFIRYQEEVIGPYDSSILTTVFTLSNSNNILVTNPITIVTISANKTIILPPVASSKGTLYHFKILTATNPYTLKIFPCLVVSPPIPPLETNLYTTSLTYDSVIEGVAGPLTFNSTTTRNTLTLISDGTSWSILNRYTDTLTIGALTGAPTNTLSETTETKSFQYTYVNSEGDYYSKILLASSTSSYLKYIFITNADSSPLEFTIYLPISKAFETSPAISSRYALFTFTIPAGKVAGFILTYVNDTYYIISASINPSISTEGTISATPTIISSTVSLLQNQPAYQISYYLPNFNSSISQLLILKTVSAAPTIQGEANVQFQLTKDQVSLFSPATGSAVWFIGYQFSDTRQYYLPVCYYLPPA